MHYARSSLGLGSRAVLAPPPAMSPGPETAATPLGFNPNLEHEVQPVATGRSVAGIGALVPLPLLTPTWTRSMTEPWLNWQTNKLCGRPFPHAGSLLPPRSNVSGPPPSGRGWACDECLLCWASIRGDDDAGRRTPAPATLAPPGLRHTLSTPRHALWLKGMICRWRPRSPVHAPRAVARDCPPDCNRCNPSSPWGDLGATAGGCPVGLLG